MPTPRWRSPMGLAGGVALAACVLRVWHLLILRQFLDAPVTVALWLGALFVLFLIAARPGRAGVFLAAMLLSIVFLFHWNFERAASDGREYFVQVRSLVIDHDLDFRNEIAVFGVRGTSAIYPFGAAILWAPFMLLAHGWLTLLNAFGGSYPVDGLTNPYQRAIGIGTLLYGFTGLVLIWRVLRDEFGRRIAALALVAITYGSFMLWYLTVENSMVHGASMFSTTLFLVVWHRGRSRPGGASGSAGGVPVNLRWWAWLGLSAGLMAMVRWQNVTFIAAPVALSLLQVRRDPRGAAFAAAVFGAAAFVAFSPQLIFWQIVRGSWHAIPTNEHAFSLASLHMADVLFSSNHGLFTWTPLAYFAVLGLLLWYRRDPALIFVLLAGLAGQVLINGGVETWWGGSGFGARRFDNCMLAFGVGLASLLTWCRARPLAAPVLIVGVLLAGNLTLMQEVRSGHLPTAEGVTFAEMLAPVTSQIGNPFSLPYSAYFARAYDASPALYDRLKGRSYNNVEIDFGETGDDGFLGHGWLAPERNDTMSFRWATGAASSLVVPLKAADNYRLEFTCSPFEAPGRPPQTIDVVINGKSLTQVVLRPGVQSYRVNIPAAALRQLPVGIRFVFGYSVSPREAGTAAADDRSLAVMFDTLRLTRVGTQ